MSLLPTKVFAQTMASGATLLTTPLDCGRAFARVYLEIPTMASGTDIYIQASSDGTTYRRIYLLGDYSTMTVWSAGSATTQCHVQVPAGFRYYKPELTTALTDTVTTWRLICGD